MVQCLKFSKCSRSGSCHYSVSCSDNSDEYCCHNVLSKGMKGNVWFDEWEEKTLRTCFFQRDHPTENATDLYWWAPVRRAYKGPSFQSVWALQKWRGLSQRVVRSLSLGVCKQRLEAVFVRTLRGIIVKLDDYCIPSNLKIYDSMA